ncbi:efflux RND transporter periplasmic adaptor subunit [Duganella sp. FT134W]|uniref:Efflux RND transporter periplasmic adaptor subunit n=1 Tax=Duganella margarita TaxID=2692170 RepID=A0A7X4GZF5_9BURK|nr:efflux RND transporter periplasmic adaptor subunit [Duganella margarita]MYM72435.1 efflux RND transporter periplasmic adaptor subunit [Duganella margarita]
MAKRPTTKRMLIMVGLVILLIAVLAFGKFLQIKKLIASAPKPAAQVVTAVKAATAEWQPQLTSVGTLAPVRGVDVTTEIAGLVREVRFKSGDEVKAGQVLFELNADSDIAQLRALQANADLAATTLKRDKLQLQAQAISQAQVDSDEADLKAKQALAAQQKALVDKKTIRAPFAGKLGITAVNPGQYLNPGDKLVTLQTIDTVYVDFFVPQKQLASLSIGQKLNLTSDAYPGTGFAAKVTSISPKIDAATRNVQVQATVPNAKRQLLPGMFANVSLEQGELKKYLTLPQTAITYNPYGSTVFLLSPPPADAKDAMKDDKGQAYLVAQQVFVTTGPTRGDQVAILTGLKEGQTVVTSGQLKLKNGTPVIIDNKVVPANSPNPTPQEH